MCMDATSAQPKGASVSPQKSEMAKLGSATKVFVESASVDMLSGLKRD